MRFAYHDLADTQFEDLVVLLCRKLLGIATQGFADGPDGGRDARFEGTAELFPSKASPWNGKVIIQAKHTNGYNKSFSDSEFFNPKTKSNVIAKEIPRIKKLAGDGSLEHYMLFSNRRLTGGAENEIRNHISGVCKIPSSSIHLCGIKNIEDLFKSFPEIVETAGIDHVDSPLIVTSDELAEVVEALASHVSDASKLIRVDQSPVVRTGYERKNLLNNMSEEYAKTLRKTYLKDERMISDFLSDPINESLSSSYQTSVEEFNLEIIAKRKSDTSFDSIFQYLSRLLFDRDPVLARNKRLTRSVLFYMYWNCDVGRNDDAPADEALAS